MFVAESRSYVRKFVDGPERPFTLMVQVNHCLHYKNSFHLGFGGKVLSFLLKGANDQFECRYDQKGILQSYNIYCVNQAMQI